MSPEAPRPPAIFCGAPRRRAPWFGSLRRPRRAPMLVTRSPRRRPTPLRDVVVRSDSHALLLVLARRGRGRTIHRADVLRAALAEYPGRFAWEGAEELAADRETVRKYLARLIAKGFVKRANAGERVAYRVTAEGRRAALSGAPFRQRRPRRPSSPPAPAEVTP